MIGMVLTLAWLFWLVPVSMLVLMGLLWFVTRLFMRGAPGVREGWITGIVGRMGQGKSLYAMTICRKHLAVGGTVISNFAIDTAETGGTWVQFTGWVTLLDSLVSRLEKAPKDADGKPVI